MATKKEKVREKVVDMIVNDLPKSLIEKLDKLLDSGAIDFENEEIYYCIMLVRSPHGVGFCTGEFG